MQVDGLSETEPERAASSLSQFYPERWPDALCCDDSDRTATRSHAMDERHDRSNSESAPIPCSVDEVNDPDMNSNEGGLCGERTR